VKNVNLTKSGSYQTEKSSLSQSNFNSLNANKNNIEIIEQHLIPNIDKFGYQNQSQNQPQNQSQPQFRPHMEQPVNYSQSNQVITNRPASKTNFSD
jgi:hypothetical protein